VGYGPYDIFIYAIFTVPVKPDANRANVAPSKVQNDGIEPALMKFIIVTQRVKIPPD
jgi:hypothetical protein